MNEYLAQAISEVNNLNEGEEFLVRDLFKGYTWNRMTVGTKLSLDKLFLNSFSFLFFVLFSIIKLKKLIT